MEFRENPSNLTRLRYKVVVAYTDNAVVREKKEKLMKLKDLIAEEIAK